MSKRKVNINEVKAISKRGAWFTAFSALTVVIALVKSDLRVLVVVGASVLDTSVRSCFVSVASVAEPCVLVLLLVVVLRVVLLLLVVVLLVVVLRVVLLLLVVVVLRAVLLLVVVVLRVVLLIIVVLRATFPVSLGTDDVSRAIGQIISIIACNHPLFVCDNRL